MRKPACGTLNYKHIQYLMLFIDALTFSLIEKLRFGNSQASLEFLSPCTNGDAPHAALLACRMRWMLA